MARTKAADPLATYRAKRDFSKTPEPPPERKRKAGNSFVIQKHAAPISISDSSMMVY